MIYVSIILPFLLIPPSGLAIDPFLVRMETSIKWLHPGLGSSIADDLAHDTKNGSIAGAQEGINGEGNIINIYRTSNELKGHR